MDISVVLGALGDYFETSGKNDQMREAARLEADLYGYKKQLDIDTAKMLADIADENDNKSVARKYRAEIAKIEAMEEASITKANAEAGVNPYTRDESSFFKSHMDAVAAGKSGRDMSMTDRKALAEAQAEQAKSRVDALTAKKQRLLEDGDPWGPNMGRANKFAKDIADIDSEMEYLAPRLDYSWWMLNQGKQAAPTAGHAAAPAGPDTIMEAARAKQEAARQQGAAAVQGPPPAAGPAPEPIQPGVLGQAAGVYTTGEALKLLGSALKPQHIPRSAGAPPRGVVGGR